jgi:hypothetical protein
MAFNLLKDTTRKSVPVDFQIGTHVDPETGTPPVFVHEMEIVKDADRLKGYGDRITQAGKGVRDKERRRDLEMEAIYSVWADVVVSVNDAYGAEVAALRGDELRAYFHGDLIPDDYTDEERRETLEGIAEHVAQAVLGWLDRMSPEPSFRSKRS